MSTTIPNYSVSLDKRIFGEELKSERLMKTGKKIFFFHHSDEEKFKKYKALVEGNNIPTNFIDLSKRKIPIRKLLQITEKYKGGLDDLINFESPEFKAYLDNRTRSKEDLLSFLSRKPKALKEPIVWHTDTVKICSNPRDLLKFKSIKQLKGPRNRD